MKGINKVREIFSKPIEEVSEIMKDFMGCPNSMGLKQSCDCEEDCKECWKQALESEIEEGTNENNNIQSTDN
jgi:hypothetical protein